MSTSFSPRALRRAPLVLALTLWPVLAANDWIEGPRPPERSIVRAPGPDPLELLLLGGGPATGYGVSTHELSLAGHLARQLASLTGRGINLEVRVRAQLTARDALVLACDADTARFDAVVLSVGVQDAMDRTRPDRWRRDVAALLARLRGANDRSVAQIFLLGVPPVSRVVDLTIRSQPSVDSRAIQFNDALRALADERAATCFIDFEPPVRPRDGRHRDSATYRQWAEQIAPPVAAQLHSTLGRQREAATEEHRARALRALSILDTPRDERFDRIVASARGRFGATAAGLSFMDTDRQWFKAVSGTDLDSLPRGSTFCEWTVRQSTPFVVEDATLDPAFRDVALIASASIRAYAGHPILDPSGTVVGALCVIFRDPHRFNDDDLGFLRQLAGLAEQLLAEH